MPYRLGSELDPVVQREALSMFVHRYTRDHVPDWAREPTDDGKPPPVQFDSDAEWLAHTRFKVTKSGRLDQRSQQCWNNPTFPDNPELRNRP